MRSVRSLRGALVLFALLLALGSLTAIAAPSPITFPRDDGAHDEPIEWWYYTGHLFTESGDRYGFEFVVFKARLGRIAASASHFAITDNARGTFQFDQRFEPESANAPNDSDIGFSYEIGGWSIDVAGGDDAISASMDGYGLDLAFSSRKPPALHGGDGFIDYGDDQGSYYYSRTRMDASGTLTVDGESMAVAGEAWFDHQWGTFATFIDGGWDWYALQLDDSTELMLYVTRGDDGRPSQFDGSYIDADGAVTTLGAGDFEVESSATWTSPRSGATYPSGWTVRVPSLGLDLVLEPSLVDQELDTLESTAQIYWEGEVTITGTKSGAAITGLGYVELTSYYPPD